MAEVLGQKFAEFSEGKKKVVLTKEASGTGAVLYRFYYGAGEPKGNLECTATFTLSDKVQDLEAYRAGKKVYTGVHKGVRFDIVKIRIEKQPVYNIYVRQKTGDRIAFIGSALKFPTQHLENAAEVAWVINRGYRFHSGDKWSQAIICDAALRDKGIILTEARAAIIHDVLAGKNMGVRLSQIKRWLEISYRPSKRKQKGNVRKEPRRSKYSRLHDPEGNRLINALPPHKDGPKPPSNPRRGKR